MKDKGNFILFGIALVAALCIGLFYGFNKINTSEALEIAVLTTLVIVTMWYAKSTRKMAKEAEEQRIMASRPIIIQKAVSKPKRRYFSNFEIYNAGNGPAIELEISTVAKKRDYLHAIRETFLRAGNLKEFHTDFATLKENTPYHLVCEYQGIFSRTGEQTWYQTWLPFEFAKASMEGEVYVTAGELEFKEVTEKERINAFRGKPK